MTSLGHEGPTAIIGGGIVGAYLAALLGRRGEPVTVFDSRPDPRINVGSEGRSINLAVAERGLVALAAIDQVEAVRAISVPMRGRIVHAGATEPATAPALLPYGNLDHEVLLSVDRAALTGVLLDAAEATGNVEIRFEQRCREVDFDLNLLTLADGTQGGLWYQVPFGTVFGADGVGSVVRSEILELNAGEMRREMLEHRYIELTIESDSQGGFRLDPNGLHIWPRDDFMLIALPNPTGDFTATLFLAAVDGAPSFAALGSAAEISAFFGDNFADFAELVPDHVEQFIDAPLGRLGTIRTRGWSLRDRAVLVGDSAHGIVPFHGQGMNLGLESALALVGHIDAHPGDLARAFTAFEADRRDDANAIADMALQNYVEMRDHVNDASYLLRRRLALELAARVPDHFAPRYNLVMFSTVPYADAFDRGRAQDEILTQIVAGLDSPADFDSIDMAAAEAAVRALGPLPG